MCQRLEDLKKTILDQLQEFCYNDLCEIGLKIEYLIDEENLKSFKRNRKCEITDCNLCEFYNICDENN
jgi:hypothetical protein